jgi:hypothetical protein
MGLKLHLHGHVDNREVPRRGPNLCCANGRSSQSDSGESRGYAEGLFSLIPMPRCRAGRGHWLAIGRRSWEGHTRSRKHGYT